VSRAGRRIALYGDVDLNLIDGSSIWLASLVEVLHRDPSISQTVLLKTPVRRDDVVGPLRRLDRVELVSVPSATPRLSPSAAVQAIEQLDRIEGFDFVVLRGLDVAVAAAASSVLHGRLWVYVTDIPQSPVAVDGVTRQLLLTIADAADRILCQTEELRSFLEWLLPDHVRRMTPLPPMIPPSSGEPSQRADQVRLVYAGKFAPLWGFLETTRAFATLRQQRPDLEFHVVGDKIHNPPDDPAYLPAVRAALESTPGLVWHGGVSRVETASIVAGSTLAMAARHSLLDSSLELSTKVLEYGQAGVPVVLNRTSMHERLLGADYPLFVDDIERDLLRVIERGLEDRRVWEVARRSCVEVATRFDFDSVYERLAPVVERSAPARVQTIVNRRRVLVAGHDLKFFTGIGEFLSRAGYEVKYQPWTAIDRVGQSPSDELLEWADVIVCEWCFGNAVWYSKHKHSGQRLIIRLHRVEVETAYPSEVNIANVDRVVVVSEDYRRLVGSKYPWPAAVLQEIPNDVDVDAMDRPKLGGAMFNLGIVGFAPKRKRLDRALDLLERLRAVDSRWRLCVKGKQPWELSWAWRVPAERDYAAEQFNRIRNSTLLRESVMFEPFGQDVSSFLRKIGFLLSPSDDESFHVGLAEGMAARCVPVIWEWPSAGSLYPAEWIHESVDAAFDAVMNTVTACRWHADGQRAREHVVKRFDAMHVYREWADLLEAVCSR
jgi:glycosyltransferase involved in cell wall biosynthesis